MHSKIAKYSLILKVPKLANLTNQNSEKLKSSIFHLTKKLQQDQGKKTKIRKSQFKQKQIKPKFKSKQPIKTNKHKNTCQ